ncbi:MAG: SO_0444 family Cu/Zn efflux transporter [candidate division Zixibacteria bacterium]|nr:SO_0444 family Cu/Zn efflux transporter [candidate division Zixibacteria bacterium]
MTLFTNWAEATWLMLVDSAFLFIIGLVLAGLLWLVMNEKNISRLIRGSGVRGVLKAALLGIPLPLCSCSVLPVAGQFRRSGADKPSVISFLISTPESGVDSIALTYTLTDPVLTVARPVTAFLTAFLAGTAETFFKDKQEIIPTVTDGCGDECGCACSNAADNSGNQNIVKRIFSSVKYAFTDLLGDLAPYLFLGFVLAGLVGALIADNPVSIPEVYRTGWAGYAGAIVIGLPLYICASSSTPLAAVLLTAGFTPGAVLVFLMVGPATNIASLVVFKKILGFRSTVRYLTAIVVVSIFCGILTDRVYALLNISAEYHDRAAEHGVGTIHIIAALVLVFFILFHTYKWLLKKLS